MLTNDGPVDRYFGMEQVPNPGIPLILIPTTAGTGSEVTSICVLTNKIMHAKEGVVSRYMYARSVILDATLTIGLPKRITAETGMDALVHAVESFTGIRANVFSDTLNLRSIEMIAGNLRRAFSLKDRTLKPGKTCFMRVACREWVFPIPKMRSPMLYPMSSALDTICLTR